MTVAVSPQHARHPFLDGKPKRMLIDGKWLEAASGKTFDSINPATGESMTFITTSRQTDGEFVLIELSADPDAFVAAAHVHPAQTETFEVLEGELTVKVDGTAVRVEFANRV